MKGLVLGLAIAVACVFCLSFAVVASEECPATIKIESSIYDAHTKGIVEFNHKEHYEDFGIACAECHHVYENGANVWKEGDPVQMCEECHDNPTIDVKEIKAMSEEEQRLVLREAFHDNCKGCHMAAKKENKDTAAPISCTQCHGK